MLVAGLIIGFVFGVLLTSVFITQKKLKGCIGSLVFANDEDGSYTFIQFQSQDVIDSMKKGDIVSFNVITQKYHSPL